VSHPNSGLQQGPAPEKFGIVAVDCAKISVPDLVPGATYYGRVIIEPTTVEHNAGSLKATDQADSERLAS